MPASTCPLTCLSVCLTSSVSLSSQLSYPVAPWTPKLPRLAQPDLDYLAPEVQLQTISRATPASDLYSLGLLAFALYNNGRSLIVAGHNLQNYVRCIEQVYFEYYLHIYSLFCSSAD